MCSRYQKMRFHLRRREFLSLSLSAPLSLSSVPGSGAPHGGDAAGLSAEAGWRTKRSPRATGAADAPRQRAGPGLPLQSAFKRALLLGSGPLGPALLSPPGLQGVPTRPSLARSRLRPHRRWDAPGGSRWPARDDQADPAPAGRWRHPAGCGRGVSPPARGSGASPGSPADLSGRLRPLPVRRRPAGWCCGHSSTRCRRWRRAGPPTRGCS